MESNSYRSAPHLLFSGSNQAAPGSMKTPPRQPPPLNCCTHPANWNLTTGSRALSLKCRRVIETGECGITVGSDGWLGADALHYLNASVSISSQTLIWLLWIRTSQRALLEAAWGWTLNQETQPILFFQLNNKKIKSISVKQFAALCNVHIYVHKQAHCHKHSDAGE